MARLLRLEKAGIAAIGPYLAGVAYEFPDAPPADSGISQAELDAEFARLTHPEEGKGMTEVDEHTLGPKDNRAEADIRWIQAAVKVARMHAAAKPTETEGEE